MEKGDVFLQASKLNDINPLYLVGPALHETGGGNDPLAKNNN